MAPPNFDRRRAEDVFKELEQSVFPRITSLEAGVQELRLKGCAHRDGDLLRIKVVEDGVTRIFEKIDDLGKNLSAHQVDMTTQVGEIKTDVAKQIGGIRAWVLAGCVAALIGVLGLIAKVVFK
jgi:hypothetical protein